MTDIFISYRRQDCPAATGRLADRLHAEFGAERVFLDVGDIVPGADFVHTLERAVASATVVLAVVGPGWLHGRSAAGSRRLDNPDDFVRREIESALDHGIPVIPVLLEGARMPAADELPPSLRAFATCQAVVLANDRWDADAAAFVGALASQYGIATDTPRDRHAHAGWRWPARLVADLAELLAHPRALIVRRLGSSVDAGTNQALLQALAMLVLCLVLGNLLLGLVLDRPLLGWLVVGVTLDLLVATGLSLTLAAAWRVVRRTLCWRRVCAPFAYLYGGAWLYFCAGALVMGMGVELVQPHVLERFIAQASQGGTDALPAASAMVEQATRGPALAAVVIGAAVWLAGLAWCVRGWAAFRLALGAGRLAALGATALWLALLGGVGALASWAAA